MSYRIGIASTSDRLEFLPSGAETPRFWAGAIRAILVGAALVAASLGSAFAGDIDGCPTFTSCMAGLFNSDIARTSVIFSSVQSAYNLPAGLHTGTNNFGDSNMNTTTAPLTVSVGNCLTPPCGGFFVGYAQASSQTNFGVNRAVATSGPGAHGTDDQGNGRSASVLLTTAATATSNWHDVWSFSQDGHASASTAVDGRSAPSGGEIFPVGFVNGPSTARGGWDYELSIFDLGNLVPGVEGALVPMQVADVSLSGGFENVPFAVGLGLDFDFLANNPYLVVANLDVFALDGAVVDLYNTARLGALTLSDGATMSAISGHDYTAMAMPVPEPEVWTLMLAGLAVLGKWSSRLARTRTGSASTTLSSPRSRSPRHTR